MEHLILEIGTVIIASAFVAVFLYFLRQPLILAYILAGVLIGPVGFGIINETEFIDSMAEIGIILLLFLIGLEMKTSKLKELGLVSLVAGVGQVLFTSLFGFLAIKLFGFSLIESLYLAVALTFSSTVIAVKLISDKQDTKSSYGQIAIGMLIVQDVLAIVALFVLSGFQAGSFDFDVVHFLSIFAKGIALALVTIFFSNKILKYLYKKISDSNELLILFSLSWCFIISLLSIEIGFSMEIGAFIAGLSLANLSYSFEIGAKTKILRDFFITIFFVALGAGLVFADLAGAILPIIALSLFVLIGNPLIVLVIMGLMGYDKKTAFFTGLTIANISEFSLIVGMLGLKLGHFDQAILSVMTVIAIITMVLSSYMITYNEKLYSLLKNYLSVFEFKKQRIFKNIQKKTLKNHIILIGCGRMGSQVLDNIVNLEKDYIVVDKDNKVIKKLREQNINCMFGDIDDDELIEELQFENAQMIISTLGTEEGNYSLAKFASKIKEKEEKPIIVAVADTAKDAMELKEKGVDYVILKHYLGAYHVNRITEDIHKIKNKAVKYSDEYELAKFVEDSNFTRLEEIKKKLRTL